MKLDAYIRLSRKTEAQIAREANTTQATVNRIRRGVGNWTLDLLQRICATTDGAVTLNDFARDHKSDERKSS